MRAVSLATPFAVTCCPMPACDPELKLMQNASMSRRCCWPVALLAKVNPVVIASWKVAFSPLCSKPKPRSAPVDAKFAPFLRHCSRRCAFLRFWFSPPGAGMSTRLLVPIAPTWHEMQVSPGAPGGPAKN